MLKDLPYKGLSRDVVLSQRKKFGFNEIDRQEDKILKRFIKKITAPIPLMIEIAFFLSLLAKNYEDSIIIFVLLVVNLSVDFFQEQKAHKALNALKKTLAPTALVVRQDKLREIPARELVPGDIVRVDIGMVVPADLKILDDETITVDQSSITGESLPQTLGKGDTVYAGSVLQTGSVFAEVEATGSNTVMGKNMELVELAEREKESHFQKAIILIGKYLIVISIFLIIATAIVLFLRGDNFLEIIRFALVLAIASIPVALPAVLSVTLALGASALSRKKTIVTNFTAIEELAGVDVLCVDKTGTLTRNEISVGKPKLYGHSEEELFTFAFLALEDGERSPIERAIYKHVLRHGYEKIANRYEIKEIVSFDPVKKTTEAVFEHQGEYVRVIMGAPQVIKNKLTKKSDQSELDKDIEEFADNGFRSLAVAIVRAKKVYPVGLIPLLDPPRKDSKLVISELKKRGIIVKMLTGDNLAIARYIAKVLNIGKKVMGREILSKVKQSKDLNDDLKIIKSTNAFAEVIPEDKFNIVKTLQQDGKIVAMTGDGVNDAPALKKADIGIAVSGATPAARSASDLVLLNNGLSVIKEAIDLARQTFARMQSYATFRIAETIRIIFFIALAVLFFNFSPLSAVMIIMLALLNDIPVLAIAYDNVPTSSQPIRWHLRETLLVSTVLGLMGLLSSFLLLYYLDMSGLSVALIQTIFFVKMDVSGHSTLYLTRTGRKHFWEKPYPSLKFFLPAFSSRLLGSAIAYFGVFIPAISLSTIALIWIYATVWFIINDQVKVLTYKLLDKYNS